MNEIFEYHQSETLEQSYPLHKHVVAVRSNASYANIVIIEPVQQRDFPQFRSRCSKGTFVILHGWTSHAERWPVGFVRGLAERGHRVILPTYADTFQTIQTAASDLANIFADTEIYRCNHTSSLPKVSVLGHSMGGMIAQELISYTASHPHLPFVLRNVILCGTGPPLSAHIRNGPLPHIFLKGCADITSNMMAMMDSTIKSLIKYTNAPDRKAGAQVDKTLHAFHSSFHALQQMFSGSSKEWIRTKLSGIPADSADLKAKLARCDKNLVSCASGVNTIVRDLRKLRAIIEWMCHTPESDLVRSKIEARIRRSRMTCACMSGMIDEGARDDYLPPNVLIVMAAQDPVFPPYYASLLKDNIGRNAHIGTVIFENDNHCMLRTFASPELLRTVETALR